MTTKTEKTFHGRGLTSFFATFGFLILALTGIMLYIVPAGRIAEWVHWSLFGLTKTQWGNIHVLAGLMFLIAGGFHIYFNWKPLMKYLINRVKGGVNLKKELYLSLIVSVVLMFAAAKELPPFNYVFELSDYIKEGWIISEEYEPPVGHAEMLSLKSFSQKQNIDLDKAVAELQANNIKVSSTMDSLGKIAKANETSPMNIYRVIRKFEPKVKIEALTEYTAESVENLLEGKGVGRKNLDWLIKTYKLDELQVKKRLETNNITFQMTDTFHDIADRIEVTPMDIVKVVMVKKHRISN